MKNNFLSDLFHFVFGFVIAGLLLFSSLANALHVSEASFRWDSGILRSFIDNTEVAACQTLDSKVQTLGVIVLTPISITTNTGLACSVLYSRTDDGVPIADIALAYDLVNIAACPEGEARDDITGSCTAAPDPDCPDGSFTGHIPAGLSPSVVYVDGCPADVVSASNQHAVGGLQVIAGTWEYQGGTKPPSCTGEVATAGVLEELSEAPACRSSECLGQVSGQWVCVACSQSPTPNENYDESETASTDENDDTTTEKTEQKTTYGSGGVTQTTTTTTTNASGVASTTTMAQTSSHDNFCQQNPTSPICKGAKDPCVDNPDLLSCIELGTPVDNQTLGDSSIGVDSITPVSIASNGTCPADVPLPKGMTFSWEHICDGAEMMNPIILAVAWLSAGLIMIGGFKA